MCVYVYTRKYVRTIELYDHLPTCLKLKVNFLAAYLFVYS